MLIARFLILRFSWFFYISFQICIVEPECSLTLASDPIQYLLLEGKGSDPSDHRLQNISKGVSKPREGMKTILSSALNLPNASACVYLTRSNLPAENQDTGLLQSFVCNFLTKKISSKCNIVFLIQKGLQTIKCSDRIRQGLKHYSTNWIIASFHP